MNENTHAIMSINSAYLRTELFIRILYSDAAKQLTQLLGQGRILDANDEMLPGKEAHRIVEKLTAQLSKELADPDAAWRSGFAPEFDEIKERLGDFSYISVGEVVASEAYDQLHKKLADQILVCQIQRALLVTQLPIEQVDGEWEFTTSGDLGLLGEEALMVSYAHTELLRAVPRIAEELAAEKLAV